MVEQLRPGFRFYPTEEELVCFYLHNQLHGNGRDTMHRLIPVVDIYDTEPWNLPSVAGELCREDTEQWFFFVPRQEREARGGRPSRSTTSGYWKGTGSPGHVYSSDHHRVIGVKKTMVFYQGKAPSGHKTTWKMNEYRAIIIRSAASSSPIPVTTTGIPQVRNEFSLCRVYVVSGYSRAFDRRPLESLGSPVGLPPPGPGGGSREQGGSGEEAVQVQDQCMELTEVIPETTAGQLDGPVGDWDWDWEQLNH